MKDLNIQDLMTHQQSSTTTKKRDWNSNWPLGQRHFRVFHSDSPHSIRKLLAYSFHPDRPFSSGRFGRGDLYLLTLSFSTHEYSVSGTAVPVYDEAFDKNDAAFCSYAAGRSKGEILLLLRRRRGIH